MYVLFSGFLSAVQLGLRRRKEQRQNASKRVVMDTSLLPAQPEQSLHLPESASQM